MSNDTPHQPFNTDRSPNQDDANAQELRDVTAQIDRIVEEASRVREQLIRVRKQSNRELNRPSQETGESENEQRSAGLRQLHQEEAALGESLRELEKKLSDLWSRRRILEGRSLQPTPPSDLEAEEQRLRWSLLELKNKQMEAGEQWRASEDPAERSRQELRFNELRDQYNAAYNKLNEIREARQKER